MSVHALYLFKHSRHGDRELRFSLRSLARAAPWVGKVWVFGDRPEWLAEDKAVIEHVPHEYTARIGRWKLPLRNQFLMLFAASLIPGLSEEFPPCAKLDRESEGDIGDLRKGSLPRESLA